MWQLYSIPQPSNPHIPESQTGAPGASSKPWNCTQHSSKWLFSFCNGAPSHKSISHIARNFVSHFLVHCQDIPNTTTFPWKGFCKFCRWLIVVMDLIFIQAPSFPQFDGDIRLWSGPQAPQTKNSWSLGMDYLEPCVNWIFSSTRGLRCVIHSPLGWTR